MPTSQDSSPRRDRLAWLRPVLGLAVLLVSLLQLWEALGQIVRQTRRRG